jgi:hypothetical protein
MIIVVVLAVAFLVGALAGVLVIVRLAVGREEQEGFLTTQAPTRATAAARSVAGLYVRKPGHDPLPGSLNDDWENPNERR